VGRGCLGRPWLFADLAAAFEGRPERRLPTLGEVATTMRRHGELLVASYADGGILSGERDGCIDFRKHVAWYLKGFPVGSELRQALATVSSLTELDDLLGKLDGDEPYPAATLGQPRGRTNAPGKVYLPDGWLQDRDADAVPVGAELDDSGG
jgi:tRNA-dihydrouridine synthase